MPDVRLLTLDPGHFHAALVHKEMATGVDPRVHVYAPLGPDLLAHLGRIVGFNARAHQPTCWELDVHAGADYLERFVREKPGNVVVLSGRNAVKIDYLEAAVNAGLNVLADKPWIIRAEDFPRLEAVLHTARQRGLVAYDIMTERFVATTHLQKILVNDRDIFGDTLNGTDAEPAVYLESTHYLSKTVAGTALRRPVWFFDTTMQGEGLTDVGTHLVDLVMWVLFPEQPINHLCDLQIRAARRWPTLLSKSGFARVTGEDDFPPVLAGEVKDGFFAYFCNTMVGYTIRGVHARLNVLWDFEAPPGAGDAHQAIFRGSQASIEVRQSQEQQNRSELYVSPSGGNGARVLRAVRRKIAQLQPQWPGVAVVDEAEHIRVTIPDKFRVGHEAHFGEVARQFFQYLRNPQSLPAWEKPNILAKYWLTTHGVKLAQATEPEA